MIALTWVQVRPVSEVPSKRLIDWADLWNSQALLGKSGFFVYFSHERLIEHDH
jgi:hypothetical protein